MPGEPGIGGPPRRATGWTGRARGLLLTVAVLVLGAAAGLAMLGVLREEAGTEGLVVGAVLAGVPVLVVVAAFVWLDRWEPEPARYLFQAFVWGATVAALVSVVVNSLVAQRLPIETVAVVVAPVVEEASKAAFVVLFAWVHRHEFDGVVDGIVLAGLSAGGFAFTENILYFGRAYTMGLGEAGELTGAVAAGATFVLRGVLSPFAHPLFTVMTGLGIGLAVASSTRWVKVAAPLAGYAAAVGLHALWNGSALLGDGQNFLAVYLSVMVPLFAAAVALAVWSRQREGSVLRRQLPAYVAAGWVAPWEVTVLASLSYRRRAAREAEQVGGDRMRAATKAYHAAATELAFLRERVLRGTATPDSAARQSVLLAQLVAARAMAYVPAPAGLPER